MSEAIMDRKTLSSITNMIRPALASAAYVPALTHICFDGERAEAYNDVAAMWVRCEVDFEGCVPGELLIKALGSFSSEKVSMIQKDESHAVLKSGRSTLKLPTLPKKDFPSPQLRLEKTHGLELTGNIIKGIRACLMSVGNDPTHPAQMGVTLDANDKGEAILYSTDNFTLSRYRTNSKIELPADAPVILPTFFCQQVCNMWSAFSEEGAELRVGVDFVVALFGKKKAGIFSKIMPELEALDFAKRIDKVVRISTIKELVAPIPNAWEASLQRALLVLDGVPDKVTTIDVDGDHLLMETKSPMGDSDDRMGFEGDKLDNEVLVDPSLLVRASKQATQVAFTDKVTVLTDDDHTFLHLIAHCSK